MVKVGVRVKVRIQRKVSKDTEGQQADSGGC